MVFVYKPSQIWFWTIFHRTKHFTNGHISGITSCTRKGCPPSASMFALFSDALTTATGQNQWVSMQTIYLCIRKIRPNHPWKPSIIHLSKSTTFPLHWDHTNNPSPISISAGNINYLGIHISLKCLFYLSFTLLLKAVSNDLQWRMNLPIYFT